MTPKQADEMARKVVDEWCGVASHSTDRAAALKNLEDSIKLLILTLAPRAGHVVYEGVMREVLEAADCEGMCYKVGELLTSHELEPGQTVMILSARPAEQRKEGRA